MAEGHLGREQMIITGERQGDNSALALGGVISHLNVEVCCVCCVALNLVLLVYYTNGPYCARSPSVQGI